MLSSLRNFIVSLLLFLVIFGAGAYFLVGWITGFFDFIDPVQEEIVGLNPDDSEFIEEETNNNAKSSQLTILVVGIDDGQSQMNEKKEADAIYLIDINSETQKRMISPIPCETQVTVKNYILRLGMVMAEYGIEMLVDTVKSYTGITVDYYFVFEYTNIIELMELLGEVEFDVPMDMFYMPERYPPVKIEVDEVTGKPIGEPPEPQKPEIDLKRGTQLMDGEKIVQLFRYKDYSNGNLGRISTQMDFLQEIIRQKVTLEFYTNARLIYNSVKDSVVTTMKETDFNKYMELIFASSSYEQVIVEYPGQMALENGALIYKPSTTTAFKRYEEYRKKYSVS